jgi:inner membrane protein involved in colicin E2 resistance
MNGGLIGFGLGFIAASLALHRIVSDYLPQYASTWQFRGVAAVGGLGLLFGIGFEIFERRRLKKEAETETEPDKQEE